jgi:TRAP-type C4-dicarboxylate transport system permease small subunit
MEANPVLAMGVAAGLVWGAYSYYESRKVGRSLLQAIIVALALGTPLYFVLVPVALGAALNGLAYRYIKRNWTSFLASLLGLPPLFGILQATGGLFVSLTRAGPMNLGQALAVGIGIGIMYALLIVAGALSYVLSSLYVSFRRRGAQPNH